MYQERGATSGRKIYNDTPSSAVRQSSSDDRSNTVQDSSRSGEPAASLKPASSSKPLPPSPPPEEQIHKGQELPTEPQPVSQNATPSKSSEPPPASEPPSLPHPDPPVEAPQVEVPPQKQETTEAPLAVEQEEKSEPLANLWAKRMQNLVSGLSFSASASSTSSASSVGSETPVAQSSTAPTTAPSLSSRDPSKSTQQPPAILSVPLLSAKPVTTPQIVSSSVSSASLSADIDEAIQSPQVQQQKQAVQSAAKLAALLASTREMNNSIVQGASSSWSVLGWLKQPFTKGKKKAAPIDTGSTKAETTNDGASVITASSSAAENTTNMSASERASAVFSSSGKRNEPEGARDIMLYAPLIPDSASTVEVASSEVVTLYDEEDGQERAYRSELRRRWFEGRGYISRDALRGVSEGVEEDEDGGDGGDGDSDGSDTETEGTVRNESGRADAPAPAAGQDVDSQENAESRTEENAGEHAEQVAVRERVIWKPSPTQISVQVLWWGYRMCVRCDFYTALISDRY